MEKSQENQGGNFKKIGQSMNLFGRIKSEKSRIQKRREAMKSMRLKDRVREALRRKGKDIDHIKIKGTDKKIYLNDRTDFTGNKNEKKKQNRKRGSFRSKFNFGKKLRELKKEKEKEEKE